MATTRVTTRLYPKRKRAEVSYHESSSSESEVDEAYNNSVVELTATGRKKLKASRTNVSTKPLPKRKVFPFTSLPAELKNQIYALALTDPNGIFLACKTKRYRRTVQRSVPSMSNLSSWDRRRHYRYELASQSSNNSADVTLPALIPNILLLNRAIHAETQPILYAGNTFAVEDTTAMHAFLANIGPKNRATITDLTIKAWGYSKAHKALNLPAFTMLASAVNLTRLHIDCQISWGGSDRIAKQLYRDAFHWLEAVGAAKGKFDAAIEMIDIPEAHLPMGYRYGYGYNRVGGEKEPTADEKLEEFSAELRRLLR